MGRIIVVGDTHQSIYGFRGADITAMANLKTMLQGRSAGCESFPLSVCRRCPKSHIRLAQAIVPDIKYCVKENDGIDAPEGEIYQVDDNKALDMMQEGDLGLSRVNRVLIPVAYALIKRKKKVIIRGRDIGKGLIAFIRKLEPKSIEDLIFKIEQYEANELERIYKAENIALESGDTMAIKKLSKKAQAKIEAMTDKTGCIRGLCEGVATLGEVVANIESIFAEFDDEGKPKDAIVLGTVHRTKGLEAHNVFMIDPENFPHQMASQSWEVEQEYNLAYVGVTRAKFQLDDQGNVIQPGRLIFIGGCPPIFKAHWLGGLSVYPKPEKVETVKVEAAPVVVEPVKVEAVVANPLDATRQKLIELFVRNNTPREKAVKTVSEMSDRTLSHWKVMLK